MHVKRTDMSVRLVIRALIEEESNKLRHNRYQNAYTLPVAYLRSRSMLKEKLLLSET